jgi:hypothetical protein
VPLGAPATGLGAGDDLADIASGPDTEGRAARLVAAGEPALGDLDEVSGAESSGRMRGEQIRSEHCGQRDDRQGAENGHGFLHRCGSIDAS